MKKTFNVNLQIEYSPEKPLTKEQEDTLIPIIVGAVKLPVYITTPSITSSVRLDIKSKEIINANV